MNELMSSISEVDIQNWVGPTSFKRGQAYFRQGSILNPRRQGRKLKANCMGSSAPSYRVEVNLGSDGIEWGECSCPVGASGHCKHVACLLLTWLDAPHTFKVIEDLDESLERRSKEELIALIHRMLQRDPELEILLELPLPEGDSNQETIDRDILREQVDHAFRGLDYERGWMYVSEISRELDTFSDLAGEYMAKGEAAKAATITQVVVETILAHEDAIMGDEAGLLSWHIHDCTKGLGECLSVIEESDQRQSILKSLLEIYLWDVKMGGIGLGDQVPEILVEQASLDERKMISKRIEVEMAAAGDWAQSALGGLLLELQVEYLDDEAYLDICRRSGRLYDLVERLLKLMRVEEAIDEATQANDYELPDLADLFVKNAHGKVAEGLVRERIDSSKDTRLLDWLVDYSKNQGNIQEALALVEKRFWLRPSIYDYVEIRSLAANLDRWPTLRREILSRLESDGYHGIQVEIFVEENEIDLALAALEQAITSKRSWWYPLDLSLKVAEAAETDRPKEAIRLYTQEAERLIAMRGRGNYFAAAEYLIKVRSLYKNLGEEKSWEALIIDLRERHKRLPALQDELNKAGL
jgi:uncharacterized Zn finger protein